jgi:signal transduction histidine kinase
MSNNHISSTEFTTLCQSQMNLLRKGLGAVWSIVYLTEELTEDGQAQLFPFAIYPQTDSNSLSKLPAVGLPEIWQQLKSRSLAQLLPANLIIDTYNPIKSKWETESKERQQLILPLIYQDTVLGLLVAGRKDRDWQEAELRQVEEIASTLAIARFLELQYQWTQEQLVAQQNLRRIEHDRLDDLLHQLRNPLTALRTFSKLLIKRLLPEDRNLSVAKSILEQSDRFQELLQQFEAETESTSAEDSALTLSTTSVHLLAENQTNQGNFLLPGTNSELESINIKHILEPLLTTAKAIAEERKINLIANMPNSIPAVVADFKALREVLNNLIDNALKYTPAGGKVCLDIQKEQLIRGKKMLGIAIKDTGYGITLKDQERIFERHYRGIQAESDIPGTGLGLAIAKELIAKMQGEIELISPNNLEQDTNSPGTTFIVWLPMQ